MIVTTPANGAPSNYDNGAMEIHVDPDGLFDLAKPGGPMAGAQNDLGTSVSNINNTWNNLKVGWVGATASEAQDFNNKWNTAITQLFGDPNQNDKPTDISQVSGALPRVLYAIQSAGFNYGEAEDAVVKSFNNVSNNLNNPGPQAAPVRNDGDGPITEEGPQQTQPTAAQWSAMQNQKNGPGG